MKIPAARFAALDGVDSKRPAMSVGRGEDRRLQICPEIVPKQHWMIGVGSVAGSAPEKFLEAMRFGCGLPYSSQAERRFR